MKVTSLFEDHKELNAKIVDFAGWQMPIQYENLKSEVQAVRSNVGVFDVSHMGEFLFEGKDALTFIDNLVTNDIKGAGQLKAIYSPLCREDGTVIDDLIVYKISSTKIFICVNAANIDKDISWIKSQIGNYEVNITDQSDQYSLLAIQGPNSLELLSQLDLGFKVKDTEYYSLQLGTVVNETQTIIARTGYTGEDGFELFASHTLIKSAWKKLIDLGAAPCGLGARDVLRMEVAYPLYGQELQDDLTPLDSALRWTVKMDKPQFIGKEALANYRPKKKLIKFVLNKGIPRTGYSVINESDTEVGVVTSGTMSVTISKGIGLALIDKEVEVENLSLIIRNKKYPIEITKKPFVTGGHK